MTEDKPIKLHIRSSQTDSQGTVDSTEFYTEGKYYQKQDNRYISYEESEVSGMEGTTTILELGREDAVLERSGAICSRMIFRPGCETKSKYATGYGDFELIIQTQKLDIKVCNEKPDSVYLKYKVGISLEEASTIEMNISVSYS